MNERFIDPLLWCYDMLKILTIFAAAILTAQAATAQTTQESIDAMEQSLLRSISIMNGELSGQVGAMEGLVDLIGDPSVNDRFGDLAWRLDRLLELADPGPISNNELILYNLHSQDFTDRWEPFSGFLEGTYYPIASDLAARHALLGQEIVQLTSLLDQVSPFVDTSDLRAAIDIVDSRYSEMDSVLGDNSFDDFLSRLGSLSNQIDNFRRGVAQDIADSRSSGEPIFIRNHQFDGAGQLVGFAQFSDVLGFRELADSGAAVALGDSLNDALFSLGGVEEADAPFGVSAIVFLSTVICGILRRRFSVA